MNDGLEYIRKIIKLRGYMTRTQIILELKKNNLKINNFDDIIEDGFHKIKYTNQYVSEYTTKDLFFYNPNKERFE